MQPVELSVIMLTYNREDMVGRAISCLLQQTFPSFELIIVNNGSTDSSGQVAEEFARQDPRIRVIHTEKTSIGVGRNRGLDEAKGEYIAFFDDDDTCDPDFLEFLHTLALEQGADVAICGSNKQHGTEQVLMTPQEAVNVLLWRKKYNAAFPTKLIRRTLMNTLPFSETCTYDDITLMYKVLAQAKSVVYNGAVKYHFSRHEGNSSAWSMDHTLLTPTILQEYLKANQERTLWLGERFPDDQESFRYFEWSFMLSMVEKISRLELTDCYPQRATLVQALTEHQGEFLSNPWVLDFEREWMARYLSLV